MNTQHQTSDRGPRLSRGGLILYPLMLVVALAYAAFPRVGSTTDAGPVRLAALEAPAVDSAQGPTGSVRAASDAVASETPTGPQPNIVFENTVADLGEKVSGENLEATFKFRNEGKGTLVIERVKPG